MTRPLLAFRGRGLGRRFGFQRQRIWHTLRIVDVATDDAQLMLRYRGGDVAAFEQLYARYKGPLYRYLLHRCQPKGAAVDVFQEVWSRLITHRERYEVRASFKTYLYRIAHHCAIDHYRRNKRADQMDDIDAHSETLAEVGHEQPEAQASQMQLENTFQQALAELPDEQRVVFLLAEEGGLALKEIAEVIGAPIETVKSRLRYALAKLRRGLANDFVAAGLRPARVES